MFHSISLLSKAPLAGPVLYRASCLEMCLGFNSVFFVKVIPMQLPNKGVWPVQG